jgi:hypothetical protein
MQSFMPIFLFNPFQRIMSAFARITPADAVAPNVAGQTRRRQIHCGLCDGVGHNSKSCRDQRILGTYRQLIAFDTVREMNRVLLCRPISDVERDANFILANFKVPTKKWKWNARDKITAVRHIYNKVKSSPQNLYTRYQLETNSATQQGVLQDLQEMILRRDSDEQARVLHMVRETEEREKRQRQLKIQEEDQRAVDERRIVEQCARKKEELLKEMISEFEKITNAAIRDAFLVVSNSVIEDMVRVYKEKLESDLNMRREANKNGWTRINIQIDEENCPICFDVMDRQNCVMFECNHQLCFKCLPRIQKCHMCRKAVAHEKSVDYEFGLDPTINI